MDGEDGDQWLRTSDSLTVVEPGGESSTMEPGTSVSWTVEPEATNEGGNMSPSRSTPDSDCCSICLCGMVNKSFTDSCMHQFCFICLKQWSKVKAECPLCKQNFKSIYYNVCSIDDYQQYVLPLQRDPPDPPPMIQFLTTPEGYYDLRIIDDAAEASLMQCILNFDDNFLVHSPSDTPVILRRNLGQPEFRRNVYQQNLWVQRLTDITGRTEESCPTFYRTHQLMVNRRLVPWLRRELSFLCSAGSLQRVLSIILDLIVRVPIRSRLFTNTLAQHIGRHTEHFVHEFYTFATAPYDVRDYDRLATYLHRPQPNLTHHRFRLSQISSSSSSDEEMQQARRTHLYPHRVVPINVASDSDDCVIVDSLQPPETHAQPSHSPEVITLESDDDVEPESTSTNSVPSLRQEPSRSVWPLKRSWVTVPSSPSLLQVSININLPGPSSSRSRSRMLSHMHSSSDSDSKPDWTTDRKPPVKKKPRRKLMSDMKIKSKTLNTASNKSPHRGDTVVNHKPKSSKVECQSLMLPLKKRHQRPVVSTSSSGDEPLQIHEPHPLTSKGLDLLENNSLLKSVKDDELLQIHAEPHPLVSTGLELLESKPLLKNVTVHEPLQIHEPHPLDSTGLELLEIKPLLLSVADDELLQIHPKPNPLALTGLEVLEIKPILKSVEYAEPLQIHDEPHPLALIEPEVLEIKPLCKSVADDKLLQIHAKPTPLVLTAPEVLEIKPHLKSVEYAEPLQIHDEPHPLALIEPEVLEIKPLLKSVADDELLQIHAKPTPLALTAPEVLEIKPLLKSVQYAEPLQIHDEPHPLALIEPEVLEIKPHLQSVVKSEIKTETQNVSDLSSSSVHDIPQVCTEKHFHD